MGYFIIRIVLHGAEPDEYSDLHDLMDRFGAHRTIVADDGTLYDLPDAMYRLEHQSTAAGVRDAISIIAKAAHSDPDPSVLVIEWERAAWSLAPVPGRS